MTFKLGQIHEAEHRLRRDFVDFSRLWTAVREDWLDERREQFERQHLSSVGPALNRFSAALNTFCETVIKADGELEDRQRTRNE